MCEESELEIEECEVETIPKSCLDNLEEEAVFVRRKSLRSADHKSTINKGSAQEPIEEDEYEEDLGEKITNTEYQELICMIEDHVILPFDLHEWENDSLPMIRPIATLAAQPCTLAGDGGAGYLLGQLVSGAALRCTVEQDQIEAQEQFVNL
ncbi:hypothetical protein ACROYT_G001386 [Oculina patagonica]